MYHFMMVRKLRVSVGFLDKEVGLEDNRKSLLQLMFNIMKMRGLLVMVFLLLCAGGASAQNQLGKTLMSCEILHITKSDTILGDYTIYDYDSIGRITDLRRYKVTGELYEHLKLTYCGCIQDTYEKTQTGEWEMRDRVEYLDSTYEYDQYSAFFIRIEKNTMVTLTRLSVNI